GHGRGRLRRPDSLLLDQCFASGLFTPDDSFRHTSVSGADGALHEVDYGPAAGISRAELGNYGAAPTSPGPRPRRRFDRPGSGEVGKVQPLTDPMTSDLLGTAAREGDPLRR